MLAEMTAALPVVVTVSFVEMLEGDPEFEACDDGNGVDSDNCQHLSEARCGDGFRVLARAAMMVMRIPPMHAPTPVNRPLVAMASCKKERFVRRQS